MTASRHGITSIDGTLDWFESNATGGGEAALPFREVSEGMWVQNIQYGTGNALSVEIDGGLLQVDTGIEADHARGMIEALRAVSDAPVTTIVYSHGHTAYNHGVESWLEHCDSRGDPRPTIVAQRNVLKRYARYRETQEYLERVTEWQFGFPLNSIVGTGMFQVLVDPDVTFIDETALSSTGRPVQLLHGWWDRNITSVHPAPAQESARAVLDAITDKDAVLDAARGHLARGELQLGLHVIDLLAMAAADTPEVVEARRIKREIAAALAENSPTFMSENYYRSHAAGHPAR